MMTYKPTTFTIGKRQRPIRTLKLQIDDKPTRMQYDTFSNKGRYKYLTMVKNGVRSTPEYREYVEFLKKYRGMHTSKVLPNVKIDTGKKYSIELHHEPFSLMEICDIVLTKREAQGESIAPLQVIEEVLELHYDGKVGLVPLDITTHELCEKMLIFIPLQDIYQRYDKFYDEYSLLCDIPEKIEKMLEIKVELSEKLESGLVMSDMINPEFTYLDVNGQLFPEVPEEWGQLLTLNNREAFLKNSTT